MELSVGKRRMRGEKLSSGNPHPHVLKAQTHTHTHTRTMPAIKHAFFGHRNL